MVEAPEEPKISVFGEFLVIFLALASISTSASAWSLLVSLQLIAPIRELADEAGGYIVLLIQWLSSAGTESGAMDLEARLSILGVAVRLPLGEAARPMFARMLTRMQAVRMMRL